MPSNPKVLVFSGSIREKSYNTTLAKLAVLVAKQYPIEVTYLNLADYPLPLMNQDLEAKEGLPENAKKLKNLMASHDGFIIASPEYNSAITPLLKNTIDWASRSHESNETPLKAYKGKFALILSASPGALGGLRSLYILRFILGNIGVTVIPDQMAVMKANEAFDEAGNLKDAKLKQQLEAAVKRFVEVLTRMKTN